jgi:hypothetical protein
MRPVCKRMRSRWLVNDGKTWPARLTFSTRRFSPSVGPFDAPVEWCLRISCRHLVRVLPWRAALFDLVASAPVDRFVEQ